MRKRADDNMYNIGSNIRTARKRADLTQEQLSEKIGVTPQYLSDLERGLVGTSLHTLVKICDKLNVSADFILFGQQHGDVPDDTILALFEKINRMPRQKAEKMAAGINLMIETMGEDPDN